MMILRNRSDNIAMRWDELRRSILRPGHKKRLRGLAKHGKVDGNGHGAAALAFVTAGRSQADANTKGWLVEHAHGVGMSDMLVRLRLRTMHDGGDGGGNGERVRIEHLMAVLERVQSDELGELTAQDFGMTAEVMNENLRSLLVFGKVAALVETSGAGRVHEEVGRPRQLDDETARPLRSALGVAERIAIVQRDVLYERERILDLVPGGVVVDVVRDATFFGRVEDDEVHGTLADSTPRADAQRAASKVVNHWES